MPAYSFRIAVIVISLSPSLTMDNFTTAVYHGGEAIELTMEEHDTPFVALIARVLVNANDAQDLKIANHLQH